MDDAAFVGGLDDLGDQLEEGDQLVKGRGPRSRSQWASVVPWTISMAIQNRPSSRSMPNA